MDRGWREVTYHLHESRHWPKLISPSQVVWLSETHVSASSPSNGHAETILELVVSR